MKRIIAAALMAALCLFAWPLAGAEQTQVEVFVARGAMERETALHLLSLMQSACPQAEWVATFEEDAGLSLRELVLADRAPQIAICAPQEALSWAKEGLLLPLDARVQGVEQMQEEVVNACVLDESLFMAPLVARHRRVAVNGKMLGSMGLSYMLDQRAHPVWLPSELYQIVEEAAIAERLAMEMWLPEAETAAGIEAFIQSLYGGMIVTGEGNLTADSAQMEASLTWMQNMARGGVMGIAEDREAALENFLRGETLMFIDWTDAESAQYARELSAEDFDLYEMPYPSADCLSVRSFELVGAAVFISHDAQAMTLAAQGVALLTGDLQAQSALGSRGIWRDDAIWLPCLSALPSGATLRSLFAQTVSAVLVEDRKPRDALRQFVSVYSAVMGQ